MARIDYAVRPAKNIERKMIAEALGRLSKLQSPDRYKYVGFGALFFRDFSLFHRILGMSDMCSIEHNTEESERYKFNIPFKCVSMHFGSSTSELPKIPLDEKMNVVWLDYETVLKMPVLNDINHVCSEASAGSVLIVTVNAQAGSIGAAEDIDEGEEKETTEQAAKASRPRRVDPIDQLRRDLPGKIPPEARREDLPGWGTARLFRTVIENQIAETLTARNGILEEDEVLSYQRLFDFHYADGPKMLTTGGILYARRQSDVLLACDFKELPFCDPAHHPFLIPSPRLTYRERRHLNLQLPEADLATIVREGIPESEVEKYSRVYRYFPNFSEVDI